VVLGPGWEPWFRVATTVTERGVPPGTPNRAVWCLIAAMVAAKDAAPWARTLARLTGHVRCADCGRVWEVADAGAIGPGVSGPVSRLAAVPLPDGRTLLAGVDDASGLAWWDAAVTGERSTMAPRADKLATVGHERIVAAAGAGLLPDARSPVLLADGNGTVSLWETFGVRLCDPLPPDPAHVPVVAVAALVRPDRGLVVATISTQARNLRVWELATDATALIGLDARPRSLVAVGSRLAIGHDEGVIVLDADPS